MSLHMLTRPSQRGWQSGLMHHSGLRENIGAERGGMEGRNSYKWHKTLLLHLSLLDGQMSNISIAGIMTRKLLSCEVSSVQYSPSEL